MVCLLKAKPSFQPEIKHAFSFQKLRLIGLFRIVSYYSNFVSKYQNLSYMKSEEFLLRANDYSVNQLIVIKINSKDLTFFR